MVSSRSVVLRVLLLILVLALTVGCGGTATIENPPDEWPTLTAVVEPMRTPTPFTEPPTTPPTMTTSPVTLTPTSMAAISVLEVSNEVGADGKSKKVAQLSIESMGLGNVELTAPTQMNIGDSATIYVAIIPPDTFAELPIVLVSPVAPSATGQAAPVATLHVEADIQIYPLMRAEMIGSGFEIFTDGQPEKPILSNSPSIWTWTIKALSSGTQTLALIISIPVKVADSSDVIVRATTLKSIDLRIRVLEIIPPTEVPTDAPVPTDTPVPTATSIPTNTPIPTDTPTPTATPTFSKRAVENIATNFVSFIEVLCVFVPAIILAIIAVKRYRREQTTTSTKPSSSKKGRKQSR